jgi:hypothetical protein
MFSKPIEAGKDVRAGLVGALGALVDLGTPFLRSVRARWGLSIEEAARSYPGDDLVPQPRWSWTHGIDIDAPAARVWPWVVQMGQNRAGFYSYQWLENLAGCEIRNADSINLAWQALAVGDPFRLHPKAPPLQVAALHEGRWFVVSSKLADDDAVEPEANASWLFFVEPLGETRCRFISRFRISYPAGVGARLSYGPWLTEAIGFVMDRAMLRGVKRRAEARRS